MRVKKLIINGSHKDFIKLVQRLDEELYRIYGQLQQAYDKHNTQAKNTIPNGWCLFFALYLWIYRVPYQLDCAG